MLQTTNNIRFLQSDVERLWRENWNGTPPCSGPPPLAVTAGIRTTTYLGIRVGQLLRIFQQKFHSCIIYSIANFLEKERRSA